MRYNIILFSLLFILISCIKKGSKEITDNAKTDKYFEYIAFPDSIKKHEEIFGKIKINLMELDTLNISSITSRYIFLYVTTEKVIPVFDSIKKVKHKIFIDTLGNGIFNFKATFNNSGNRILTTVLEDVIMFRHDTVIDVSTLYTKETIILLDVYVEK